MAEKKYYWLKLKEDFFDDDTIEWIEEQENGDVYCLFYLKLCLKSLKTNGILVRNVGEMLVPYDVNKLADMTRTNPDTVRVAMEVFKKIGLVQILENGEIFMTQLNDMVGSESKWAEKKRLQRAKNVEKSLPDPVNGQSGDNVPEMSERERVRDKEIEIRDRDKEIELTNKQKETIELLAELFAGWSVNNNQILFLSQLAKDQIPYQPGQNEYDLDIRIFDGIQKLVLKAKADDVKNLYRWLMKMIPLESF